MYSVLINDVNYFRLEANRLNRLGAKAAADLKPALALMNYDKRREMLVQAEKLFLAIPTKERYTFVTVDPIVED